MGRAFHKLLGALALPLFVSACAAVEAVGHPSNVLDLQQPVAANRIHWPSGYDPRDAAFYVHNEIDVAAEPQVIWDVLIQAETWPSWYSGAQDVHVAPSADGVLRADSTIRWETMGLEFVSSIKEFSPPYRLSWESRKDTIQGYHAWLLVPVQGGRTRLITAESQHGFLATMQPIFVPHKLHALHDLWLAELKKRAEAAVARKSSASLSLRPSHSCSKLSVLP